MLLMLLCFAAFALLLAHAVNRVRKESERQWGAVDESGIRRSLQILLRRGYEGAFVTFSERDTPEFVQLRKSISAAGQCSILMHFPKAPWSERYYDNVGRTLRRLVPSSVRIPVRPEPVVEFIEADFGADVDLASAAVVTIFKEVFGRDNLALRVRMDDVYPSDVLVDRRDFPRLTLRDALRIRREARRQSRSSRL